MFMPIGRCRGQSRPSADSSGLVGEESFRKLVTTCYNMLLYYTTVIVLYHVIEMLL